VEKKALFAEKNKTARAAGAHGSSSKERKSCIEPAEPPAHQNISLVFMQAADSQPAKNFISPPVSQWFLSSMALNPRTPGLDVQTALD